MTADFRTSRDKTAMGDFTDELYWRLWSAFEPQTHGKSWLTLSVRDFRPVGTMDIMASARFYPSQVYYARELRLVHQPDRGKWLPRKKLITEILVLAQDRGVSLVERIGVHAHRTDRIA